MLHEKWLFYGMHFSTEEQQHYIDTQLFYKPYV